MLLWRRGCGCTDPAGGRRTPLHVHCVELCSCLPGFAFPISVPFANALLATLPHPFRLEQRRAVDNELLHADPFAHGDPVRQRGVPLVPRGHLPLHGRLSVCQLDGRAVQHVNAPAGVPVGRPGGRALRRGGRGRLCVGRAAARRPGAGAPRDCGGRLRLAFGGDGKRRLQRGLRRRVRVSNARRRALGAAGAQRRAGGGLG